MKKITFFPLLFAIAFGGVLPSCINPPIDPEKDSSTQPGITSDTTQIPDFDYTIADYSGEMADDAANDAVGTNTDFYWEANSFSEQITIVYEGRTASVTSSNAAVLIHQNGANVMINMLTNGVKNAEIIVSGKTDNGQLKIYGGNKFKLTLNGVELHSAVGPAINCQCKKRCFVHLTPGTTNRISDAADYSAEPFYIDGASIDTEDRKGCFFSEGHLVFSGTGILEVEGKHQHGISTDGYFYMRPGVTIAIKDAAKNSIHAKGDTNDGIGISMQGGLIYATTSATAGKCLKSETDILISGGKLLLNTSGDSEFDSEENDTSSPSCMKADGNVIISGGTHVFKSTGSGGKGISTDGILQIEGGITTITTTGNKYTYNSSRNLTSSPKGVKADGSITINGGQLNISVTGESDGSEGIESKSTITINGGSLYVYAYDDAMNASTAININGGKVFCYAINNDGIDSNGTITIAGGLVIGSGSSQPEEAIDCDRSTNFKITGGIVIGTSGTAVAPSSASTQRCVLYNGIAATQGTKICILNSSNTPILTYELPRTMSSMSLLFSSPDLESATYTVWSGGTLTSETESWGGWFDGGTYSGGSQIGSFTASSIITTIGNSGGPGGGGGGPGGRP